MSERETIQQQLLTAFRTRPRGMINPANLLENTASVLRRRYGFREVRIYVATDLLKLTDEQAELALKIIGLLDIPADPDLALRVFASRHKRAPQGT